MRLGWEEIRRRAREFSVEWKDAHYEKGETQTFYNDFFEVFGINRRRVAIFEKKVEMIDQNRRGFIDLFWPAVLLVEQKSAGKNLDLAQSQALDYVLGLKERDEPKFVLTCDFQRFRLLELETRQEIKFTLPELHKHVEAFAFMLGVQRRHFGTQAVVNIKAAELLGKIHDAVEAKGYTGKQLEQLMVRLLFCLFADDTGIFENKDDFMFLIDERTDEDGANVGRVVKEVFEILDTPLDQRLAGQDPEFTKFPYVNGELFKGDIRTPVFDAEMRDDLLTACRFDWGKVSPAIFGSLFQSVMDSEERRKKGAHYTTEPNIMKVIGPLFLDELHAEFEHLKARRDGGKRAALLKFQEKLGTLNFFDPACGCGNFLVVTYRELRKLEQEVLELVYDKNSPLLLDVEAMSVVSLNQFFGIELEEFPAHIAEVAMWMTEHLANVDLGRTFGKVFADIPLNDSATIHHGDALEIEWSEVLPARECYAMMGNPPFVGAKYQSPEQRQQVRDLAVLGKSGGTLDFVCAWFLKAGAYINETSSSSNRSDKEGSEAAKATRSGFVATNSITQGEQVAQLWPILFDRFGLEISFAHRTFAWGSDARGKAHVHVVIIGLTHHSHEPKQKRLFSYDDINGEPDEVGVSRVNPYLIDAAKLKNPRLLVSSVGSPINEARKIRIGSKPIDGGYLLLKPHERSAILEEYPKTSEWIRPYVGTEEFLNSAERYILALQDVAPSEIKSVPVVFQRISAVKEYRAGKRANRKNDGATDFKQPGLSAKKLSNFPTQFHVTVLPKGPFLAIPENSSENREYIPIGWMEPPVIPSNKIRLLSDASLFEFGVLTSRIHMDWMRQVGGRLESRYQYSIKVVYNNYPWPEASKKQRGDIEILAQAVLDARAVHVTSSLADLYDPDAMPGNLRKAHAALDQAVDRLYRKKPFDSDRDRVEHLFGLYEKLVDPLTAGGEKEIKRVARNVKRRKENE